MYEAANQFLNEKLDSETAKAAAAEKQAEEWHRRYTNLAFSIDEIVRPLNAEAKLASPDPNAWERFELAHDFGSDLRRINAALKTGAAWRAKFDDLANTVDLMHGVLTNTQSPQPAADVIKKWEAISDYAAELAIEFAPLAIDGPIEPRVRRAIAVER